MDEERLVEESTQPLLITVTDTEEVPELRSISSNNQESESNNISQCILLFKLCFAITIIVISIAWISLIIWITPTPPTVNVHSMHISFNNQTLPVWSATFSIKNPNEKLYFTCKNPSVWMFHRRRLVWKVKLESFEQKSGEENEIVVKGDQTGAIDEVDARKLEKEVTVMGSVVGIDLVFKGRVGFYPGTSALWGEQNMTAVCENVSVKLSNDDDEIYETKRSALSFYGRRDCRVRLPMFS